MENHSSRFSVTSRWFLKGRTIPLGAQILGKCSHGGTGDKVKSCSWHAWNSLSSRYFPTSKHLNPQYTYVGGGGWHPVIPEVILWNCLEVLENLSCFITGRLWWTYSREARRSPKHGVPLQHFNAFPLKDIETKTQNLGKNILEFAVLEIPENFPSKARK